MEENNDQPQKSKKRTRTSRTTAQPLPDPRLTVEKQIKVLKAIYITSNKGANSVSYQEIAPVAGMHATLVSGVLGFFYKIGLLTRDKYKYKPTPELLNFCNELEWSPENAGEFLREGIQKTWFGDHVIKLFQMNNELTKDQIVTSLGKFAQADSYHNPSILKLVDLLLYSKIIELDESSNSYKKIKYNSKVNSEDIQPATEAKTEKVNLDSKEDKISSPSIKQKVVTPNYGKNQVPNANNSSTNFNVNIDVKITDDTNPEELAEKVKKFKELIK